MADPIRPRWECSAPRTGEHSDTAPLLSASGNHGYRRTERAALASVGRATFLKYSQLAAVISEIIAMQKCNNGESHSSHNGRGDGAHRLGNIAQEWPCSN